MTAVALSLLGLTSASAEVSLAPLFRDHAVLQREKPVPVWGWADPGEKVQVSYLGQTVSGVADTQGRWLVTLAPMAASSASAELVVEAKSGRVTATDVVVGEVWVCSGQSNMEWPVAAADRAAEEMPAAQFPLIRHLKVERENQTAAQPTVRTQGWVPCRPDTVGHFTAVGYYFAKEIHSRLGIPVGLVNSSWGGTPVEAWIPTEAFAGTPVLDGILPRWNAGLPELQRKKAAYAEAVAAWEKRRDEAKARNAAFSEAAPEGPGEVLYPSAPAGLYNGMIHGLLPAALRGFLLYQGESNTGRPQEYADLFRTLISSWRERFGQGDLPFYFVQLANFSGGDPKGTNWAVLRDAQTSALALPGTGQVVILDIGDANDIHPRNKHEVGRRLALLARARLYGQSVDASGPQRDRIEREGSALRIHFRHTSGALLARERPLQAFEIAGADRKFYPATARIVRDSVVVSAPEVKEPVAVRYAWCNAPEGNLFNGAGLPAWPFRSDDWP